jgi:predicted secreted protein
MGISHPFLLRSIVRSARQGSAEMGMTFAIAIYFVIWWTTLFAVLPIGVRTQSEAGEIVPGTPASAPVKPRILWIAGVNTLVSALVFAVVWFAFMYGGAALDPRTVP